MNEKCIEEVVNEKCIEEVVNEKLEKKRTPNPKMVLILLPYINYDNLILEAQFRLLLPTKENGRKLIPLLRAVVIDNKPF